MIYLSKVKGHSMSPSYMDGDYLLSVTRRLVSLQLGDVIIIKHPVYGDLVKQICRKEDSGYFVQGTNALSTGSDSIGLILPQMIEGKVVLKIR